MQKELLMIAGVVIVGALVVNKFPGSVPLNFRSVRGMTSVEAATVSSPEPAHKGRAEAKNAGDRPKAPRAANTPAIQPTPNASPPVSSQPAPNTASQLASNSGSVAPLQASAPFPTPETLKSGATATDIVARFGPPSFDVAGTRDGRVLETYYYVSHDRSRMTVINLQNGLLTGIDSRSSPYFQLRVLKD